MYYVGIKRFARDFPSCEVPFEVVKVLPDHG